MWSDDKVFSEYLEIDPTEQVKNLDEPHKTEDSIPSGEQVNDSTDINEGLVDVIFSNLKTNLKVNVSGNLIYFRWEWMGDKTMINVRMRMTTLDKMISWLQEIQRFSNKIGYKTEQ